MKLSLFFSLFIFSSGLLSADPVAIPSNVSNYPLSTCVVSGEPLIESDMGLPIDYIHTEPGKHNRLVRFCCKSCIKTFKKDPEKYLKILDQAKDSKK
jgi:hypothetical protein